MTMRRRRPLAFFAVFGLAFILLLPGCAPKKGAVKTEAEAKPSRALYYELLSKWTKSIKVYDGLDTRLYVSATYKDRSVREAYIKYYVASYQADESYAKSLLDREAEQAEQFNEFFFSAYTPEEKWNDFESKESIWKIFLEDGSGAKMVPASIKRLDRSDPLLREMFPYFDFWSSAYVVKFPKYSETGKEPIPNKNSKYLRMTVTGIIGKGELTWNLHE